MCLEKTARYLLGKITNRDAKNVWKLIQLPGQLARRRGEAAGEAAGADPEAGGG